MKIQVFLSVLFVNGRENTTCNHKLVLFFNKFYYNIGVCNNFIQTCTNFIQILLQYTYFEQFYSKTVLTPLLVTIILYKFYYNMRIFNNFIQKW